VAESRPLTDTRASQVVLDVAATATVAHFKRISFVCSVNHLTITHVAQTRPNQTRAKVRPSLVLLVIS